MSENSDITVNPATLAVGDEIVAGMSPGVLVEFVGTVQEPQISVIVMGGINFSTREDVEMTAEMLHALADSFVMQLPDDGESGFVAVERNR